MIYHSTATNVQDFLDCYIGGKTVKLSKQLAILIKYSRIDSFFGSKLNLTNLLAWLVKVNFPTTKPQTMQSDPHLLLWVTMIQFTYCIQKNFTYFPHKVLKCSHAIIHLFPRNHMMSKQLLQYVHVVFSLPENIMLLKIKL